jgi:hypothetical protein
VAEGDNDLFRKAALDRLASPDRLDERLALPRYPRTLLAGVALALAFAAALAAWLATAR